MFGLPIFKNFFKIFFCEVIATRGARVEVVVGIVDGVDGVDGCGIVCGMMGVGGEVVEGREAGGCVGMFERGVRPVVVGLDWWMDGGGLAATLR